MINKPRMVTVIDDELRTLLAYGPDDLGAPTLYKCGAEWKADAEELRRWRGFANQQRHAHVGSPTIDRGETCIECGKDMHDPVHGSQSTSGEKHD
jgi:hypothetical protein